jgi:serine/threonine protein phosphatase 1
MTDTTAFVGDVHGHLDALIGLVEELFALGIRSIVLLGDYINRGPNGAGVIKYLSEGCAEVNLHPLLGNHEAVFLECMESGDIRPLLRMSGAPTVRSYIGGPVGPDVFAELRAAVPEAHLGFLRNLPTEYSTELVLAAHVPRLPDGRYQISAHVTVGPNPRLGDASAEIDTGCGSGHGRLTGLLWPSRQYVQVDEGGRVVVSL